MRYLSTLSFPESWLDALRTRVPGVEVLQVTAEKACDVPDEVWRGVDVLHTSAVLPDLAVAERLRWVQLDTSGVDHVRDTAVWDSDLELTTIGGVSPVPLAEYVLFAILGFAHRLPAMLQARDTRSWPTAAARWTHFGPMSLDGARLGIVGYGRIGREIGRLARAHGLRVTGLTRTGRGPSVAELAAQVDFSRHDAGDDAEIVGPDRLHELLGSSDFVVVVAPLTDRTRNMIDADAIAALKPGAVLIDVARGGIVDEAALLAGLRSGAVGGAALDVFAHEPLAPDSPWWTEPNVLATPHIAGLAPRYEEQVLGIVATNLARFVAGQPLLNRVDRVRGY